MVSDTADVESVIFGPEGVAAGAARGSIVVDMSTISPVATRAMAARLSQQGVEMLDAPVSGGDIGAINATLSIMVGGQAQIFARLRPLFACMGKNIVHVGGNGAGQVAKCCNQIVASVGLESVAEALTLSRKNAVDPAKVRDALLGGFAWSKVLEVHGGRMIERHFEPGFKARLFQKDLRIVVETAAALGIALPQSALAAQHLNALVGMGCGEEDSSALVKVIETLSGLDVSQAAQHTVDASQAPETQNGTSEAALNIGFIGLGAMGRPMGLNLLKAGHSLRVWARRNEQTQALVEAGAQACPSVRAVAEGSDVVFTMVTRSADVEAVVLGEEGVVHGARPGTVVIDCSTIGPGVTRRIAQRLAQRGIQMLDAPVSGGEKGAVDASLSIMVGGDAAVFERMRPVFTCVGRTVVHIGPNGAGQVAKAANQLALVVTIQGIAEAAVFAQANGVDFERVWEALTKGFAGSRMLEVVGRRMLDREFVMGIDASLHHKDSQIVLECAHDTCTAVPGAALAAQAFNALFARPNVRWDSAAILHVMAKMSGQLVE
jgi:2-hydroxy-3-oxopropionate reductase